MCTGLDMSCTVNLTTARFQQQQQQQQCCDVVTSGDNRQVSRSVELTGSRITVQAGRHSVFIVHSPTDTASNRRSVPGVSWTAAAETDLVSYGYRTSAGVENADGSLGIDERSRRQSRAYHSPQHRHFHLICLCLSGNLPVSPSLHSFSSVLGVPEITHFVFRVGR